MVLEVVLVVLEVVLQLLLLQLLLLQLLLLQLRVLLKLQTLQNASGPPSYIQVGPPGSDFRGPGAQQMKFKHQKPQKLIIWVLLSDPLKTF